MVSCWFTGRSEGLHWLRSGRTIICLVLHILFRISDMKFENVLIQDGLGLYLSLVTNIISSQKLELALHRVSGMADSLSTLSLKLL
jgi:hypothetical protein